MKTKLLLLIILLLIPAVIAEIECSKVYVVKFNYNNGLITYKDKVIKCGYAPDNKIQPEEGYRADIISEDNNLLYSFKFEIPLRISFDLTDPVLKTMSGGMLILNETDFALVFPYYDNAGNIIIYNPREYKILSVPLAEEHFVQAKPLWLFLILLLLMLAVLFLIHIHNRHRKNKPEHKP